MHVRWATNDPADCWRSGSARWTAASGVGAVDAEVAANVAVSAAITAITKNETEARTEQRGSYHPAPAALSAV
jgi:hypothetical protein